MKYRIFFWSITSALAAFLFRFNAVGVLYVIRAFRATVFPVMVAAFAPGYVFRFICRTMVR